MRNFFIILYICVICIPAYANDTIDLIELEQNTDNQVVMTEEMLSTELESITSQIAPIDPNFIESLQGETVRQKIRSVRSYLAEKSFNYYFDKYMQMLRDASTTTGREIKSAKVEKTGQTEWWLDRGELDDAEKCFNPLERVACDYPNGFTEFSILYTSSTTDDAGELQTLSVTYDDITENQHITVSITLNTYYYKDNDNLDQSKTFNIYIATTDYNKWYSWKNQEKADIRAGMLVAPEEQSETNSTFGKKIYEMDTSRNWESNTIPGEYVWGINTTESKLEY